MDVLGQRTIRLAVPTPGKRLGTLEFRLPDIRRDGPAGIQLII